MANASSLWILFKYPLQAEFHEKLARHWTLIDIEALERKSTEAALGVVALGNSGSTHHDQPTEIPWIHRLSEGGGH